MTNKLIYRAQHIQKIFRPPDILQSQKSKEITISSQKHKVMENLMNIKTRSCLITEKATVKENYPLPLQSLSI